LSGDISLSDVVFDDIDPFLSSEFNRSELLYSSTSESSLLESSCPCFWLAVALVAIPLGTDTSSLGLFLEAMLYVFFGGTLPVSLSTFNDSSRMLREHVP